jgi:16S rRNA (cytosine967-C5)-methyltransferase
MKKNISENILKKCLKALEEWDKNNVNLDEFLDSEFRFDDSLRKTVSSALFSYFRNKALVDELISSHSKKTKPKFRRILTVAITQSLFQTGIASESACNVAVGYARSKFGRNMGNFVNAVLRKTLSTDIEEFRKNLPLESQLNLPKAIYQRWKTAFGIEDLKRIASCISPKRPIIFRATSPLSAEEEKASASRRIQLPDWTGNTVFYECCENDKLFSSGLLESGKVYIQDPSTAMAPFLADAKGKERILDLCAAPGGKSALLYEKLSDDGLLVAADRSFRRQKLTHENFIRMKIDATVIAASALAPPFKNGSFDLVFVDAPCSNTGVSGKRPDSLWNFSEKKLNDLLGLQEKILDSAYNLCAPGGRILYSTCSLEKEENSGQTTKLIEKKKDLRFVAEKLLLPEEKHDGCYAALLEKAKV